MKYPYALIFDMDGVMVDNHVWHFRAWKEFCNRHGKEITEEMFYTKLFGGNNQSTLVNIFNKRISKIEEEMMGEEKETIYREMYASQIKEVAGLGALLRSAGKALVPLAIASSAPLSNIDFTLRSLNLEGVFDAVVHSGMIAYSKPHPEIFMKAAGLLGKKPHECIVFEDSLPGIASAKAAGCHVIALATTLPPNRIQDVKHILSDFTDVNLEGLLTVFNE